MKPLHCRPQAQPSCGHMSKQGLVLYLQALWGALEERALGGALEKQALGGALEE